MHKYSICSLLHCVKHITADKLVGCRAQQSKAQPRNSDRTETVTESREQKQLSCRLRAFRFIPKRALGE